MLRYMENIWSELSDASKERIIEEYIGMTIAFDDDETIDSIREKTAIRTFEYLFGKENLNC